MKVGYLNGIAGGGSTTFKVIAYADLSFAGQPQWQVLETQIISAGTTKLINVPLGQWAQRSNLIIELQVQKSGPALPSSGQPLIVVDNLAVNQQLATSLQPPAEGNSPDKLGMDMTCNFWSMDQAALEDCTKDLDLIKDLGIGTVRIGSFWYMMTDSIGNLAPAKAAFLKSLMNAARTRGMKILF